MTVPPFNEIYHGILTRNACSLPIGTRIKCCEDWVGFSHRNGTVIEFEGANQFQLDNPETLSLIPHPETNELIPDDGIYYMLSCEIVNS